MKRIFLALLIVLLPVFSLAGVVNIPPDDPQCKESEEAICTQTCSSTTMFCGTFGIFKDGKFIEGEYKDCNTTTCSWNCICVPKEKSEILLENTTAPHTIWESFRP